MAEDNEDNTDGAGDGGEDGNEGEGSKKAGGKKKLIIIIAAVLLILIGGAAGAYFTGLLDPLIGSSENGEEEEEECEETEAEDCAGAVFYDLQELMINLNTGGQKSSFLKIRVSFELGSRRDKKKLDKVMPKIIDNFQTYLRELRIDDLKGSAGIYRLREELLIRVNTGAAPIKIKDVLFKEMLIQ